MAADLIAALDSSRGLQRVRAERAPEFFGTIECCETTTDEDVILVYITVR